MNLTDSYAIDVINKICSSNGHFKDEMIQKSYFYNILKNQEWFCQLSQIHVVNNADDLILKNENKILQMEKRLKDSLGDWDLCTRDGFENYINHLYSKICEKKFFFVKESKIESILESCGDRELIQFDNFSAYDKMCASRLVFDAVQHERLYMEYQNVKKGDLSLQPLKILVLDNKSKMCEYLLTKKCTVWDEKIGGTIFACPLNRDCSNQLPYLRTLFRFFHYYFELLYSSEYYTLLGVDDFGYRFSSYIKGAFDRIDFFEPHALLESVAWQQGIRYIANEFTYLFDDLWKDIIVEKKQNRMDIHLNCIADYISNMTHLRKTREWRVSSMIIKEKMFERIVGEENVIPMLLRSMDSGSMKNGYEYYMYHK